MTDVRLIRTVPFFLAKYKNGDNLPCTSAWRMSPLYFALRRRNGQSFLTRRRSAIQCRASPWQCCCRSCRPSHSTRTSRFQWRREKAERANYYDAHQNN